MGPRQYASQTNPPKGRQPVPVVIIRRDQDTGHRIYGPLLGFPFSRIESTPNGPVES
jgi:hypothetical protein